MDKMDKKAIQIITDYVADHLDKSDPESNNIYIFMQVYIVWKSKILKNWKYLISTSLLDGMYYELTFNGERNEWYLDVYKKFDNKIILN